MRTNHLNVNLQTEAKQEGEIKKGPDVSEKTEWKQVAQLTSVC